MSQYFESISDYFIEGYLKMIISLGRMTPKLFLKKKINKDVHNWERFTWIINNNFVQVFQDAQSMTKLF